VDVASEEYRVSGLKVGRADGGSVNGLGAFRARGVRTLLPRRGMAIWVGELRAGRDQGTRKEHRL